MLRLAALTVEKVEIEQIERRKTTLELILYSGSYSTSTYILKLKLLSVSYIYAKIIYHTFRFFLLNI